MNLNVGQASRLPPSEKPPNLGFSARAGALARQARRLPYVGAVRFRGTKRDFWSANSHPDLRVLALTVRSFPEGLPGFEPFIARTPLPDTFLRIPRSK